MLPVKIILLEKTEGDKKWQKTAQRDGLKKWPDGHKKATGKYKIMWESGNHRGYIKGELLEVSAICCLRGINSSRGFGWGCPICTGPGLRKLCCKPGSLGSSASMSPDGTEELNHGFISSAFQTSCNFLFLWPLPQNHNQKDNGMQFPTSSKLTTQFSRTFWTPAFLFVPQGLSF